MILAAALLLAAAHGDAVPHPGSKSDAPIVGRYAIRAGALTLCTLELTFEPTVGGQVEASKNCLPPLLDAIRWDATGRAGGFVLRDALRKEVATAVEDQFGYTLFLRDVRRFDMKRLPDRIRTDAERASGWWSVRTEDPTRVDCRVELKPSGQIGPAPCAAVKPYGGGRWNADTNGVRLIGASGKAVAFRWGDAVSLIGPKGTVLLIHD